VSQPNKKKHTVLELISTLTELVKERPDIATMEVMLEGCDCEGEWDGNIKVQPWSSVLLKR
jgi:hypothetical protein